MSSNAWHHPTASRPPRLSTFPWWTWLKRTFAHWSQAGGPIMGAGLAYYAIFSLVPMLMLLTKALGLWVGADTAQEELMVHLRNALGSDGAATVQEWLADSSHERSGVLGTLVTVAVLLVSGTTLFAQLKSSLDRLWRSPDEGAPKASMLRSRLFALLVVAAMGLLVALSMVAGAVLSQMGAVVSQVIGVSDGVVKVLDVLLGFAVALCLFAVIFRTVPQRRVSWRQAFIGATLTAVLFAIGRVALTLYLSHADVGSGFGAGSSLVALLFWVYASAQVFLLGAQATWELGQVSASAQE